MNNRFTCEMKIPKDFEVKVSRNGKNYARIGFPVGQKDSKNVTWINLSAFGRIADDLGSAEPGELWEFSGRLELNEYNGKTSLQCMLDHARRITAQKEKSQEDRGNYQLNSYQADDESFPEVPDDDIMF